VRLLLPVILVLSFVVRPSEACELCDGPGSDFESLQERMEAAKAAALARPTGRTGVGQIRFTVTKVLKGERPFQVGDTVTPNGRYTIIPGRTWLLLASSDAARQALVVMLTPATLDFLEFVPTLPPKTKLAERLAALAPFLVHKDSMVAASARKAFAEAPYDAVHKAALRVDPDGLIETLSKPRTAPRSRGTLFLLVGLSGRAAHRKRLSTWMAEPSMQTAGGYDALLAAWLLMTGPDGLVRVREVRETEGADGKRIGRAFIRALRFHARNGEALTRAEAVRALEALQADPHLVRDAELALEKLETERLEAEAREKEAVGTEKPPGK
jgi:hypothetical protein